MNTLPRPRSRSISHNLNQIHDEHVTPGERLSESLARVSGSWTFIIMFCGALVLWIGVNGFQLLIAPFDRYPYILLNLIASCLAAVQASLILMSLNRQAARDRLAAELDDAARSRTEAEIEQLHEKLDRLCEKQWLDLVELQQHQIVLLNRLLAQRDTPSPPLADGAPCDEAPAFDSGHVGIVRQDDDQPRHPPGEPEPDSEPRRHRRARVVNGQAHVRRSREEDAHHA